MPAPEFHADADALADRLVEALDGRVVLGLPLGLGKATRIANALYRRAAADRNIRLDIYTALTLEPPSASSDMERRFVEPFKKRVFAGYERLAYAEALRDGSLPDNVHVCEFFLQAGRWLREPAMQRAYVSANYTHAARMLLDKGVNLLAQLVAAGGEGAGVRYSLSCNTDITLDILPLLKAEGRRFLMAGEVHSKLPFMGGDAVLGPEAFDHVLEAPESEPALFALPKEPVGPADHAVGIHAASLVKDGGTLQIGIGSLGDALTAALILRHEAPDVFRETLARLCHGTVPPDRHTGPFEKGLYAASEMFVDGFMELYRHGILKRRAADGALLHAGFFLGSEAFYSFLRELPRDEQDLFRMRGISFVNALYGDEERKRADRVDARFVNSAMGVTLLGEVVSDTLEGGRVVSGVGGQYNFVAQAFALDGARSVITLNAARMDKATRRSRLTWDAPHVTIPRHLRDIVVTEYGVADLRGLSDRDCIAAMLSIADAGFQGELVGRARRAGKIEEGFRLPRSARRNTAAFIARALRPAVEAGHCETFPFGTVFTPEERRLLPALALLRERTASAPIMAHTVLSALTGDVSPERHAAELERMELHAPATMVERLKRRLLLWALEEKATTQDAG